MHHRLVASTSRDESHVVDFDRERIRAPEEDITRTIDHAIGNRAVPPLRGDRCRLLAMYELYWEAGTLAMAPHITLEEVGAAYELHYVSIDDDAHRQPEFLRLNPAGTVPVLVHEGHALSESAAIMLYVASRHPDARLLPEPGTLAYGQTLHWLMFATTTLQHAGRRMFYAERFSTDESHAEAIHDKAEQDLLAAWKVVEEHALGEGPFIHGDRYSLADIYLVLMAVWLDDMDKLRAELPRVARLFDAASQRPATRRILELHEVELG